MRLSTVRAMVSVLVLCYGAALVVGSRTGFPDRQHHGRRMPYLADKPLQEDSFYMLTIAWNAGHGEGLAYNQHQRTVGVQPLNTLLYAAFAPVVSALGGDRWTFARVALAIGVVNFLLFSMTASRIARELAIPLGGAVSRQAGTIAAGMSLANFSLYRQFTNGLETGLYTILAGAAVLLSLRPAKSRSTISSSVALGAVAGIASLARVDFLVVSGGFFMVGWLRRSLSLREATFAGATAAVVASPWLLWVHHVTGHWIPSSGLAQAGSASPSGLVVRAALMALAVLQQVSPWLHVEAIRIAVTARLPATASVAVLGAITIGLAALAAALARPALARTSSAARRTLANWVMAFGALFAAYPVFFFASYFYPRYATPLVGIGLPLLAVGVAATAHHWVTRTAVGMMPIAFVALAFATLHNGSLGNVNVLSAGYVSRVLPATRLVGAFQSGAVGYFNQNVVNLDGKVNADALASARNGALPAYIDDRRIAYLVDWPGILAMLPPEYVQHLWEPCPTPVPDAQIACLARR